MTVSTDEFWGLLQSSQLVPADRIAQLRSEFEGFGGSSSKANANTIGEWLVSTSVIQPFHCKAMLDGNGGPFLFGDYLLMDRISQPAMNGWFRARHRTSGHPVVLQFMVGKTAQDSASWEQLISSVHQHAAVTNRLTQQVYEPLDLGNYRIVVYEDMVGSSLRKRLTRDGALAFDDACRVTWTIAQALAQLHQQGLVHGCLTPDSILFPTNGGCRLLLNLSPTQNPLDLHARPQDPEWLPYADYLAPELGQAQQQASPTTDVYALGSCFYEMLNGQPPFPGGGLIEKLQRHAATSFPAITATGIPANFERLLAYLVNKDPARRYVHAGDIPDKLQLLLPGVNLQIPPIAIPESEASYKAAVAQQKQAAGNQQISAIQSVKTPPTATAVQGFQPVPVKPAGAMDDPGESGDEVAPRSRRRKRRPVEKSPIFWGAIGTAALAVILLLAFNLPSDSENGQGSDDQVTDKNNGTDPGNGSTVPRPKKNGNGSGSSNSPRTGNNPPDTDNGPQLVDDDGKTLWQSPTEGKPLQLHWLPPGAQLLIAARPADLIAHGGEDAMRALGPVFATKQAGWEKATGIKFSAVKKIVMGLYNNDEQFPRPAFVVELDLPMNREQLLESFGNPDPVQVENGFYFKGQDYSFVIPEEEGRTRFVMGHEEDLVEVLKFPGKPPPIPPTLGRLLKLSDDSRHFTAVFVPTFLTNNLFRDGRSLQIGEPRRIRGILEWILDDSIGGGMVSMHMDGVFYLEARLYAGLSRNQFQLASEFKQRMAEVPDKISEYMVLLNPHMHWRRLAFQYPQMIGELHQQTRVGVDGNIAIVNSALPPVAATNLLLGAELCLVAQPTTQIASTDTNRPTMYKSIEDALKLPMTVGIPQQDLNLAVVDIENEVKDKLGNTPFPFLIKIIGDDLKLEGITRNQAIRDFTATNKPLSEVLTGLVMKANPDPTVKDPSEQNQKLIWVLGPDPAAPENKIILITTRVSAMDPARKYEIPQPFKSN